MSKGPLARGFISLTNMSDKGLAALPAREGLVGSRVLMEYLTAVLENNLPFMAFMSLQLDGQEFK
jgi:hypothetical protein